MGTISAKNRKSGGNCQTAKVRHCDKKGYKMTVKLMYEAAIEAIEHVGQTNWSGRVEAAKVWLKRILDGKTDKSLDQIQKEINEN